MTSEECVFKTDGNVDIKPSNVLHDDWRPFTWVSVHHLQAYTRPCINIL